MTARGGPGAGGTPGRDGGSRGGEDRYRALCELSPVGIIVHARDRVVYANPAAAGLLATTPADLLGRSALGLVAPEFRDAARERIERASADGGPGAESRWLRADGAAVDVEVHSAAVAWEGGRAVQAVFRDIGRRRRAQALLREGEERLRLALEVASLATWDWDLVTGRIVWSDEHYRMQGYAVGEVAPSFQAWADRVHPDDLPEALRRIELSREARADYRNVFRILLPGGAVRWCSALGRFYYDEAGRPVRMVGVIEDVTDELEARAALEEGRRRQEFLLRLADTVRPLADPGAIQAATARLLGGALGTGRALYAEIEADGRRLEIRHCHAEGVPPLTGRYSLDDFDPRLAASLPLGGALSCDDVEADPAIDPGRRSAFAAIRTRAWVAVPLVREGRLAAILSLHHPAPRAWTPAELALAQEVADRTWAAVERARAEAALRESEGKYRTLFDSIDEGYCVIRMLYDGRGRACDWVFEEANPAMERHNGLRDVRGRTIRELAPDIEPKWVEIYDRVARTGEPSRFEEDSPALGRVFNLYAFRIGAHEERRVAVIFSDVTGRRRAEEALRRLNAELEDRVRERTAALRDREERLRLQGAELTQVAHRERQKLARILHDDVQQLLVAARMRVSNAAAEAGPAAAELLAAASLLGDAVGATRTLAVELAPPFLHDQGLPAALEWLLGRAAKEHGLEVEAEVDEDANPSAPECRDVLFQAAREFLLNAAKHAGRPEVTVRLARLESDVWLEVCDRGPGLRWEPGEDVPGSFGLYQVRRRLEAVGGELSVETAPGGGACVSATVPGGDGAGG